MADQKADLWEYLPDLARLRQFVNVNNTFVRLVAGGGYRIAVFQFQIGRSGRRHRKNKFSAINIITGWRTEGSGHNVVQLGETGETAVAREVADLRR